MNRWISFSFVLFSLTSIVAPPLIAQQGARSPDLAGKLPAAAQPTGADHRIRLDVVVTDASGKPVTGLRQQDFTVLDNNHPEKVLSFEPLERNAAGTNPGDSIKVILLVDAVNRTYEHVSYEQQALEKYLRQNGGKLPYPTTLVFFSDKGTEMQKGYTTDGNGLASDVGHYENALRVMIQAQGFWGANDRMALSVRTIEQLAAYEETQPGRKLLFWIGPGWPILSGPEVVLSTKDQQSIFNSVVSISTFLRKANITLYSVNPLGMWENLTDLLYYRAFLNGVAKPSQVALGNLAVQAVAYQSGGLVFTSSSDLPGNIDTSLADAKEVYALSFDEPSAERPDEYHQIKITIDKPGLTARTRTGYYAQP